MSADDRLAYWKRRARDAERRLELQVEHGEHVRAWAQGAFAEQRRLGDRLTLVFAVAVANGVDLRDLLRRFDEPLSPENVDSPEVPS